MANVSKLVDSLNDVFLNGIIDSCVITFDDNKAYIKAMDLTSSLYVETSAEVDIDECQIGIGDLALFLKYLKIVKDVDVSAKVSKDETSIVLKPKSGAVTSYKLFQVDLVPTFDDEWDDNMLENAGLTAPGKGMPLKQDSISEFLTLMGLFGPNSIHFEVDKKGVVKLHGGSESEHQFEVKLGKIKDVEPFSVQVLSKHLTSVLSVLDYSTDPQLHVTSDEDSSIIIATDKTGWVIQPIRDK